MKNIVAIMVGIGLLASSAYGRCGIGAFGAYWNTEDAGDGGGGGFRLSGYVLPNVDVEVRASYYENVALADGDELDVIPLELGLTIYFPLGPDVEFYAGAGAGYYIMDGEEAGVSADPDDEVGAYAISGMSVSLFDKTSLFANAKYTVLEIDTVEVEGTGDVQRETDLTGLGGEIGLKVDW